MPNTIINVNSEEVQLCHNFEGSLYSGERGCLEHKTYSNFLLKAIWNKVQYFELLWSLRWETRLWPHFMTEQDLF